MKKKSSNWFEGKYVAMKDGVIVYKPKADVNIRIDIKNKQ